MKKFIAIALLGAGLVAVSVLTTGGASASRASSPSTGPSASPSVTSSASSGATPQVSATPPALPASPPPTSGPRTSTCVNGWITPKAGTPQFTDPLGIVRRTTGVLGPLVVVDMRYFTGPESPPSDQGYLLEVERWYIKMYAKNDLSFQGRFLVELRRFGRGLSAVAPYDTHGFRSPDWKGFQFDSADLTTRVVPGLPGAWSGIEYDFVRGGAGLNFPGLPDDVIGCLDGT